MANHPKHAVVILVALMLILPCYVVTGIRRCIMIRTQVTLFQENWYQAL